MDGLSPVSRSDTVPRVIRRNSFTYKLSPAQQEALIRILRSGNYRPMEVQHTLVAAEAADCNIALYKSGKCLVQGSGAQDWVSYILEPEVLHEVRLGYEDLLNPEALQAHMGIDESGKGDFFGPLVIASAYVDESLVPALRDLNVRDSKTITSDRVAVDMATKIRRLLGQRFAIVAVGPRAYNRLYASMRNVNRILAWGHARAIENLLEKVPDCPRAVSDQFGPTRQIEQALMKKGRTIHLVQMPRAESDIAVAAASVLARAGFLDALKKMQEQFGVPIPKGASAQVQAAARDLIGKKGPDILLDIAKCHFRTTDVVLEAAGLSRSVLGPDGQAVSKPKEDNPRFKR